MTTPSMPYSLPSNQEVTYSKSLRLQLREQVVRLEIKVIPLFDWAALILA